MSTASVVVLEDTEGVGRGADDEKHHIPWCVEHDAVWVTKTGSAAATRS
jgi:hypothetical protein